MAANTVSLKLLVDSTSQRVLFAESGKDFVDFMFNILSLPIGSVIKLLTKEQMVVSLGNLYDSLENMNDTYIHSPKNKDTLLKPIVPNNAANVPPLLPTLEFSKPIGIYRCVPTVIYIIMDNLVVRPMSAISCFTLLNKFNIKDAGCVKLLKASFQSKTMLSDVFLEKKMGESNASSSSGVNSIVI
ncbi:hypothetical protein GOBAR_DD31790 [Gossypium barbadense]|nr:hypothetical protein GOBAR_DD31790 [Gossypium barbadense]